MLDKENVSFSCCLLVLFCFDLFVCCCCCFIFYAKELLHEKSVCSVSIKHFPTTVFFKVYVVLISWHRNCFTPPCTHYLVAVKLTRNGSDPSLNDAKVLQKKSAE